jgi:hypothetical protein
MIKNIISIFTKNKLIKTIIINRISSVKDYIKEIDEKKLLRIKNCIKEFEEYKDDKETLKYLTRHKYYDITPLEIMNYKKKRLY